jgi:hypothetical protein
MSRRARSPTALNLPSTLTPPRSYATEGQADQAPQDLGAICPVVVEPERCPAMDAASAGSSSCDAALKKGPFTTRIRPYRRLRTARRRPFHLNSVQDGWNFTRGDRRRRLWSWPGRPTAGRAVSERLRGDGWRGPARLLWSLWAHRATSPRTGPTGKSEPRCTSARAFTMSRVGSGTSPARAATKLRFWGTWPGCACSISNATSGSTPSPGRRPVPR